MAATLWQWRPNSMCDFLVFTGGEAIVRQKLLVNTPCFRLRCLLVSPANRQLVRVMMPEMAAHVWCVAAYMGCLWDKAAHSFVLIHHFLPLLMIINSKSKMLSHSWIVWMWRVFIFWSLRLERHDSLCCWKQQQLTHVWLANLFSSRTGSGICWEVFLTGSELRGGYLCARLKPAKKLLAAHLQYFFDSHRTYLHIELKRAHRTIQENTKNLCIPNFFLTNHISTHM